MINFFQLSLSVFLSLNPFLTDQRLFFSKFSPFKNQNIYSRKLNDVNVYQEIKEVPEIRGLHWERGTPLGKGDSTGKGGLHWERGTPLGKV